MEASIREPVFGSNAATEQSERIERSPVPVEKPPFDARKMPSTEPRSKRQLLRGWGGQAAPGVEVRSENLERITEAVPLSRGLGRSYGDSALPAPCDRTVAGTVLADRILAFDPHTGVLRAEAGLSLDALIRLLLPRGWFPPVTPGTRFVTLGGCVAADVHGKNHHVDGTFGRHVTALRLRVADGRIVDCSPSENADLFWATVGGMGLTGHILEVELRLVRVPSPWIWQHSQRVPDIETFIDKLRSAVDVWPMTMGWIDCISRGRRLGRGLLMCGRWATAEEAPRKQPRWLRRPAVPFLFPEWVLNRTSMLLFNKLYYWKHLRRERKGIVHPEAFFWPLDAIHHWNRLYGKRGFTQHQSVLPTSAGPEAARRLLETLTAQGGASFLCVIKDCGAEGGGMLSFPMSGISIAIDIPIRDGTQELVDCLNQQVIAEGGRVYLAKDQFTRPEHFAAMEPRLERFQRVRRRWDPEGMLRSAQSVRLLGDPPLRREATPPVRRGKGQD